MKATLNGRIARRGWRSDINQGRTAKQVEHSRVRNMENKQWQDEALQELAEEEYESLFTEDRFDPSSLDWNIASLNLIDLR